jgi:predicted house-cleaning NTP pyrophosphatase (Maf/HAM1 superfamily)
MSFFLRKENSRKCQLYSGVFMIMKGTTEAISKAELEEIVLAMDALSRAKIEDIQRLNAT